MASKAADSIKEEFNSIGEGSLSVLDKSNKTGSNFNDDDKQLAKKEDKNWDNERKHLDGHHGIKLEKAFFL
jgi:hypothetical protein